MSKRTASSNLTRDNWDSEDAPEEMGVFQKASNNELKMRTIRKGKRRGLTGESVGFGQSVFKNFNAFGTTSYTAPSFSFISSNDIESKNKTTTTTIPSFNLGNKVENGGISSSQKNNIDNNMPMFNFTTGSTSTEARPKKSILPFSPESQKTNNIDTPKPLSFSFGTGSLSSPDKNKSNNQNLFNKQNNSDSSLNVNNDSYKNLLKYIGDSSSQNRQKSEEDNNSKESNNSSEGINKDEFSSKIRSLNKCFLNWIKHHLDKNQFIDLTPVFDDYKSHLEKIKKTESNKKKDTNISESSASLTSTSTAAPKPTSTFNFGFSANSKSLSNDNKKETSEKTTANKEFSFGVSSSDKSIFQFGSTNNSTSNNGSLFGSVTQGEGKSSTFSFGIKNSAIDTNATIKAPEVTNTETANENETDDTSDQPPKVEVNEVKEADAVYEQKVKLFYKKDNNYSDKGVGTLFLKPAGDKTQLLVRALTNLGNILLNIILNDSVPAQRVGKNNVLIVCVPNPPIDTKNPNVPVSILIRVKTSDDADKLLAAIEEHKK